MWQVTPEISVVICTLDRPDQVRMAAGSLQHQTIDASRYEVIVVDNGSGAVAADLADLASAVANLRVLHEPVMGLSQARNRGTREACGEVVLFMDDDALAEPDLLAAHLRQFAAPHRPVATGGRIYLRWPVRRPAWVPESLETFYSGLDLGDTTRQMTFPEYPYGANMAVRRAALVDTGGFDVELGRRGQNLISGEEKDLFLRLDRTGARVDYVADAIVHHCVLPERIERAWLLRRSWAQGRSDIAMGLIARGPLPVWRLVARVGLHLWRAIIHSAGLVAATVTRREEAERMRRASQALRWFGAAFEGASRARKRWGSNAP